MCFVIEVPENFTNYNIEWFDAQWDIVTGTNA